MSKPLLLTLFAIACAWAQTPGVKHVVVIGVDGLSPDGIRRARTPNIDSLCKTGACTMHARGVMPTSSSPNWASMIMGAGPEQHGVTSNQWMPDKFEIAPVCKGLGGIFPTMFGALREQRKDQVIGIFHDWEGFGRLVERGVADLMENPKGPAATVERAVAFLKERRPALTFIHLDHVDHAGHEHAHGSPQYVAAVEEADRLTGVVIQGLKDSGLWEQTVLLLTADHGGTGKKHGGATMAEIEIPWVIHGPGIRKGHRIASPVNTVDTAPTILRLLGVKAPACWVGKPVAEAFSVQ